jgi:hypothetical protein
MVFDENHYLPEALGREAIVIHFMQPVWYPFNILNNVGKAGLYSYQKSYLGTYILEGLRMENVDIFYGHSVYFGTICYIFTLLACFTKKNLATLLQSTINLHTTYLLLQHVYIFRVCLEFIK